ncbi:MAG: hypothetical protein LBU27_02995 [Candidatus Peribacteria bacterium]|jgi:Mg2+ and Co2+ transporter CorA|nr:hypothetical protein [Candidatus Peribacteria bacterium]
MEQELVDIKNSLAAEYELYAKYDEDRAKMEQDFTEELAEQIEERKENMTDEVDHYRKEAERKVDIAQTTAQQLEEAAVRILAAQARIADSTSGG